MLDYRGRIVAKLESSRGHVTMQVSAVVSELHAEYCIIDVTDDENFGIYLESFVQISLTSTSEKAAVSYDVLAERWGIHPD